MSLGPVKKPSAGWLGRLGRLFFTPVAPYHTTRMNFMGWECERVNLLTGRWQHRHYSHSWNWSDGPNPHRNNVETFLGDCLGHAAHNWRCVGLVPAPAGVGRMELFKCANCLTLRERVANAKAQPRSAERTTNL